MTGDLLEDVQSYEMFNDRTRKWWPINTGDCLMKVTTWAGVTVPTNSDYPLVSSNPSYSVWNKGMSPMKLSVDSFPRKVIFVWQISDFRQTGGSSEYKIAIKKLSC